MADPRQILEAKKAKILTDAQRAAAEIERDIEKIDELRSVAEKYGLEIVEQTEIKASADAPAGTVIKAISRQAVEEAEKFVRAKNAPVPLSRIHEEIERLGIKVGGVRPLSTLSAYLSQSEHLVSIRKGWWWLKDVPVPWSRRPHETPGAKAPGFQESLAPGGSDRR